MTVIIDGKPCEDLREWCSILQAVAWIEAGEPPTGLKDTGVWAYCTEPLSINPREYTEYAESGKNKLLAKAAAGKVTVRGYRAKVINYKDGIPSVGIDDLGNLEPVHPERIKKIQEIGFTNSLMYSDKEGGYPAWAYRFFEINVRDLVRSFPPYLGQELFLIEDLNTVNSTPNLKLTTGHNISTKSSHQPEHGFIAPPAAQYHPHDPPEHQLQNDAVAIIDMARQSPPQSPPPSETPVALVESPRADQKTQRADLTPKMAVSRSGLTPVISSLTPAEQARTHQPYQSHHLRTQVAANYLGLSKSTLEKYRLSGNGPQYVKMGKAIAYKTEDLDAWVAARKRNSTSESQ